VVFPLEFAAGHGYRDLEQVTDGRALVRATTSLAGFARVCVQAAIEQRLQGAHVGLAYERSRSGPQPPRIVPTSLLGAVYLELDRQLRGHSRDLQPCEWGPCLNLVDPVRDRHIYCSNTCVQRARRAKGRRKVA
jgi:hypothetical protein